jgi:hypothetical protein
VKIRVRRGRRSIAFDYETSIRVLVARGLDEHAVRHNSIPEGSLDFICSTLTRAFAATENPVVGLHVGNYVGVSLAGFADSLRFVNPDSTVVAIDPNDAEALGISAPQDHVIAVLEHFDLLGSVLLVSGYSFERAPMPVEKARLVPAAPGSENVLPQLGRLGVSFDVALLDGNHGGPTVERELAFLERRLRPRGLVFLDDVTDAWPGVRDAYRTWLASGSFTEVGHDGRVGALRLA